MAVLLDTHVLIWWLSGDRILPGRVRDAITQADVAYVSAISILEIAIKVRLGKLDLGRPFPADFEAEIAREGFRGLPVSLAHARLAGILGGSHRDPFDRVLVAQSLIEVCSLISVDGALDQFPIRRIW